MKGIKCIAPVFDLNGYGQWSRGYILSLIESGIPVDIFPVSFDSNRPEVDLGEVGEVLKKHVKTGIDYDTCIAWLVPDIAKRAFDQETKSVRKVSMSLWETVNLPKSWLKSFESIDDIWVCGEFGRKIYQDSIDKAGLDKTVQVVPYPVDAESFDEKGTLDFSRAVPGKDFSNHYKFYFVSQWNARKNFEDLLKAYWHEFSKEEEVVLVLKTYISDQSQQDQIRLQRALIQLGKDTGNPERAPVILLHGAFSSKKMVKLHNSCDCFVSPSRGEGLGLGIVEASLAGNSVICSEFGEQTSYVNHCITYPHMEVPVSGMSGYTWYDSSQFWAQPDVKTMSSRMRECFNHLRGEEKNYEGKEHLVSTFTRKATSDKIVELLS